MSGEKLSNAQLATELMDKAAQNIERGKQECREQGIGLTNFQINVENRPKKGDFLVDVVGGAQTKGTGKETEYYFGMVTEVKDGEGIHLVRVKTDASGDQWLSVVIQSEIQEANSTSQQQATPSLNDIPNPWQQK